MIQRSRVKLIRLCCSRQTSQVWSVQNYLQLATQCWSCILADLSSGIQKSWKNNKGPVKNNILVLGCLGFVFFF